MIQAEDSPAVIQALVGFLLFAPGVYLAPWKGRGKILALIFHWAHRSWIVWRTLEESERWRRGNPTHLLRDWLTDANGVLIEFWVPFLLQAVVGAALIAIARKEGTLRIERRNVWPWLIPDAVLLASLAYLSFVIARVHP